MSKEKLDLEKRFELKNCVSELKVSDVADPAKVLVKLVKGDELKDDPVVGKITRLNESISQEVSKRLVFYYIKDEKKLDFKLIKKIVSEMLSKFAKEDLQFDLESFVTESLTIEKAFKLVAETIFLERFKPFSLKSEKKGKDEKKKKATVTLVTKLKDTEVIVEEVRKVVSRINLVKSLQILPPNIANSEFLADRYQRFLLKSSKIKTKVLGREELTEKGMGLLLAVNRGSEYEPRLVVAEFNNNPESKEKIALVGKGITFDSGGYNLKPSASMSEMKFDMSGSAIVAAVVSLAAELDLKVNIVGLMPLTDNKIGKKAGTPDSVWISYSGKSVEVNNTDAEGRLVLADGMAYAIRDCGATEIVTVATLTGAMLFCLGGTFTGFWSTKCENAKRFEEAAKEADELIWRMPFHNDFLAGFKESRVADLTNVNMKSRAGSSNAAMFLKEFSEDKAFSHFDIAGTAYQSGTPHAPLIKTLTNYLKGKSQAASCGKEGKCKD